MAEDLNGYFSSVFIKKGISSLQVPDAKFQETKSGNLWQFIVTPEMVAKKVKAMKHNKSPASGWNSSKLLMETVEQISLPVARVFNLLLKEEVFPFEWKKGSRNKSENHRSVSLTSVIWKFVERLIKDHMVDSFVRHKLLN